MDSENSLCIVLHAHLPYVAHRNPGRLEERWLYEVMTETYIPLLTQLNSLDSVSKPVISLSITAPLLAMLEQKDVQERYIEHLKMLIELSAFEAARTRNEPDVYRLALFYHFHFIETLNQYLAWNRRIIPVLKSLQDLGKIEIIASSATHGFLPAVQNTELRYLQIRLGIDAYCRHFGRTPKGFWLPECAYDQSIPELLAQNGIEWFLLDSNAVNAGLEKSLVRSLEPMRLPNGLKVFFRDPHTSELVWNSQSGYPSDRLYREFYRDIGWDLGWDSEEEWNYIKKFILPTGERIDTGMKYYRITGDGPEKELYNPNLACSQAEVHARHFLQQCRERFNTEDNDSVEDEIHNYPIIAMYDAELFGHWWFEGVTWLRYVFDNAVNFSIQLTTPSQRLSDVINHSHDLLSLSTWGRGGYADVWINEKTHWMYRHLHFAERALLRVMTSRFANDFATREHLQNALRQLLLAQSSDWAFIIDHDTVVHYAEYRFLYHIASFYQHLGKINSNLHFPTFPVLEDEEFMADFALLDIEHSDLSSLPYLSQQVSGVCMLTLEYPPNVVGGMGKAVCEMSEKLAESGQVIHVVTIATSEEEPAFEIGNGVHIHRVYVPYTESTTGFLEWIFVVNISLIDKALELERTGCTISLIHAHDWLVSVAGRELSSMLNVPLVVTIHATEWGRTGGNLDGDLNQRIHLEELRLTRSANHVFVCSQFMKNEVSRIFQVDDHKISVVPNGILPSHRELPTAQRSDNTVLFIGRLVYEKGLTTLFESMERVLQEIPNIELIIAGRGPMQEELEHTQYMQVLSRTTFLGFVSPTQRSKLLDEASVVVVPSYYEPFGLSALEAMQAGCPVIVSDVGGLAELVNHKSDGLRALPRDSVSLADQILYALKNPQMVKQMALEAQHKVSTRYSWDTIVDRIIATYGTLSH